MAGVEPSALMTKETITTTQLEGASMPIAPPMVATTAPQRIAFDLLPSRLASGREITMPIAVGIAPMIASVP